MKRKLLLSAIGLVACAPLMAADVGVSLSVGDPNFYGRLDIGGYPAPRYYYREPVVVERRPASTIPD